MNWLVRGSAALTSAMMNLPYGFKLALLFMAAKEVVRKVVRGKSKSKKKKAAADGKKKPSKDTAAGKKKKPSPAGKKARLCKMFTASVKSLLANKNRTPAQERCLKAARAGKKKYCG